MCIKHTLLTLSLTACVTIGFTSCHHQQEEHHGFTTDELKLKNDSTIYGLACEGCNDSTVILLPTDGSDPIKYNVIEATRRHRVLGNISTGDWIGVVLNKHDKTVADMVIDLEQLKGIWCYIVMPKLRDHEKMSRRNEMTAIREMSDSLKKTFFIPREYGFWLKRQWEASSIGYVREASTLADESPVVYPPLGYFVKWHILNGKFIMTSGKPKYNEHNKVVGYSDMRYDTCSIDYLDHDSLVLSDRDGSRSYYRKNDINEVNKKAQEIADQRTKEALEKTFAE